MSGPSPAGPPDRPDVLVVGAGPAGSVTAGLLAARGWRVLVLERARFPRAKACGECLNPGAVEVLRRLDLLDAVRARAPAHLLGWDLVTEGGARATGRFAPDVGPGLALPRAELDAALLDRARQRGARVEEGVRVTQVHAARPGGRPRVEALGPDRAPRRYAPALVVGADGLRSVVARCVGAIRRKPRLCKASLTFRVQGGGVPADRGRLYLADQGTVGIAPVAPPPEARRPPSAGNEAPPPTGRGLRHDGHGRRDDPAGRQSGPERRQGEPAGHEDRPRSATNGRLWNVTVVAPSPRAPHVFRGSAREILGRALERAAPDWIGPAELCGGPWGSGPFDWPSRPLPAPGVVLVGDAAGYFDPLTGQGIHRALRSAEMAAHAIDRTLRGDRESWASLAPDGRRMRQEFAPGRRVQRAVEAVVSSGGPRELAIRRLGAAPAVLDALIRVTGDARPVRSLAAPGLLARLVAPDLMAHLAAPRARAGP